MERLLANDRALALIVAMESALDDDRLEARPNGLCCGTCGLLCCCLGPVVFGLAGVPPWYRARAPSTAPCSSAWLCRSAASLHAHCACT